MIERSYIKIICGSVFQAKVYVAGNLPMPDVKKLKLLVEQKGESTENMGRFPPDSQASGLDMKLIARVAGKAQ